MHEGFNTLAEILGYKINHALMGVHSVRSSISGTELRLPLSDPSFLLRPRKREHDMATPRLPNHMSNKELSLA